MNNKDNLPLVSIIIPAYNRADLLVETLDSIVKQSYASWECIIVDDHSEKENYAKIQSCIKNDSRFKLYLRPSTVTKGSSSCRNYGYTLSKGDFVQWFDSDDIMHKEMIAQKVSKFHNQDNLDFVKCAFNNIDISGNKLNNTTDTASDKNSLIDNIITYKVSFGTPVPLWKRSFLEKEKLLFNQTFTQSEDLEFYSRLLMHRPNYESITTPLFSVRRHDRSISKDTELFRSSKNILDMINVYELIRKRHSLSMDTNLFLRSEYFRYFKVALYNKNLNLAYSILSKIRPSNIASVFRMTIIIVISPVLGLTGRGIHKISPFLYYK